VIEEEKNGAGSHVKIVWSLLGKKYFQIIQRSESDIHAPYNARAQIRRHARQAKEEAHAKHHAFRRQRR
jgi:hypothetical protein